MSTSNPTRDADAQLVQKAILASLDLAKEVNERDIQTEIEKKFLLSVMAFGTLATMASKLGPAHFDDFKEAGGAALGAFMEASLDMAEELNDKKHHSQWTVAEKVFVPTIVVTHLMMLTRTGHGQEVSEMVKELDL